MFTMTPLLSHDYTHMHAYIHTYIHTKNIYIYIHTHTHTLKTIEYSLITTYICIYTDMYMYVCI